MQVIISDNKIKLQRSKDFYGNNTYLPINLGPGRNANICDAIIVCVVVMLESRFLFSQYRDEASQGGEYHPQLFSSLYMVKHLLSENLIMFHFGCAINMRNEFGK